MKRRERKYGKKAPKWTLVLLLSVRLEQSALKEKGLNYGKEVCWLR